ncbi:MAG: hypothetical protein E7117_01080 [Bacteroidales bacterium]|nr:hypothetical protein [Bacteroidales bacterium]
MRRVLVIFHVYYHDQVDWFIDRMKNISGCRWELVVTCQAFTDELREKFHAFRHDVRFVEVENVGYDVWPFIKVVKSMDLSGYDCILKLHTKRPLDRKESINRVDLKGYRWRNILVDSLLGSSKRFEKCMSMMQDGAVGMVCSYELFMSLRDYLPEDTFMLEGESERIGVAMKGKGFCAGTMFMVKPEALEKIRRADFPLEMWNKVSRSNSTGSAAHVYERLLCLAVYDAGLEIRFSKYGFGTSVAAGIYKLYRKIRYAEE